VRLPRSGNGRRAPEISVVVTTHDRAWILPRALDSVLGQSWTDFELIVVDDASTDDTGEVLAAYARRDPRLRVIERAVNSRAERPETEPRNDGLRAARGLYIAHLDSDNAWHPCFLERMRAHLAARPEVQLAWCNAINHYASARDFARSIGEDRRPLRRADPSARTAVFAGCDLVGGLPGLDWYIDTNEIMHRAGLFARLGHLWPVAHPRRAELLAEALLERPGRRFGDLWLAERTIAVCGHGALSHLDEDLVFFHYDAPPTCAPRHVAGTAASG
jgi:glycosyltransferase involved in cell wall biosynthesis